MLYRDHLNQNNRATRRRSPEDARRRIVAPDHVDTRDRLGRHASPTDVSAMLKLAALSMDHPANAIIPAASGGQSLAKLRGTSAVAVDTRPNVPSDAVSHSSAVAHDLRNLLLAMDGQNDLAMHTLPENHPARRHLELIAQAVQQSQKLVSSLEKPPIEALSPIDFTELVKDTTELVTGAIDESIDVSVDVAREPIWVNGCPEQLRRVVGNLVDNARKALGKNGRLEVALRLRRNLADDGIELHEEAELVIADSGSGIDNPSGLLEGELVDRIRARRGSLGLLIVRDIARAHGGRVSIASTPGAGARFTVTLPTIQPPRHLVASASGAAGRPTAFVFLLCGAHQTRQLMHSSMTGMGHRVSSHADVAEAFTDGVEELVDANVAVVDADGMDENELRALRCFLERTSMPVVYLATSTANVISWMSPRDRLIIKPFSMPDLSRALAETLIDNQHEAA